MQPNYKSPFKLFVKKQHKPLQLAIEDAVEDICTSPEIGEPKTGDLEGISVYKFMHNRQECLIAYRAPKDGERMATGADIELLFIDFYKVGVHENFYTALKKYLKS